MRSTPPAVPPERVSARDNLLRRQIGSRSFAGQASPGKLLEFAGYLEFDKNLTTRRATWLSRCDSQFCVSIQ